MTDAESLSPEKKAAQFRTMAAEAESFAAEAESESLRRAYTIMAEKWRAAAAEADELAARSKQK